MTNLAGHDLPALIEAFEAVDARPARLLPRLYHQGLRPAACQGHKDNHAGLMTAAQMEQFRERDGHPPGHEWDRFEGLSTPQKTLQRFLDRGAVRRARAGAAITAPAVAVPDALACPAQPIASTQQGFGNLSTSWRAQKRRSPTASSRPRRT